jgi:carbamoyl-phosphate synthase small subunit
VYSNWRASESLDAFLKRQNIVGISGVDTRALTRRLRYEGVMMGAISTNTDESPDALVSACANRPRPRPMTRLTGCAA